MKKSKKASWLLGVAAISGIIIAADHIDAPAVKSTTSDITDFYAFEGEDTDNLVFVANVQGLLSPTASADARFDENTMIEFNIDTDGDNVEDLVIQAIAKDGTMHVFGPAAPSTTGLTSTVLTDATTSEVAITSYGSTAIVGNQNGMKLFAGPRDDPFFMDFARYGEIVGGNASAFNDPGADTFAGTNVLSVVIEVPKSKIGSSGTINTWVEAKRKL